MELPHGVLQLKTSESKGDRDTKAYTLETVCSSLLAQVVSSQNEHIDDIDARKREPYEELTNARSFEDRIVFFCDLHCARGCKGRDRWLSLSDPLVSFPAASIASFWRDGNHVVEMDSSGKEIERPLPI